MDDFSHIPVLLNEVLEGLALRPDGIYFDGTAGGAGHSSEIAKRLCGGELIACDQDPDAVAAASRRLASYPARVFRANFREAERVLDEAGVPAVDGALLDLGVSSHQLDVRERGFSYREDAPLDMRMSQSGPTAADLLRDLSVQELTDILRRYGEEKNAYYIAKKIVARREAAPLSTTGELAAVVTSALPPAVRRKEKNPARKTFQALRIAVNDEMGALEDGLEAVFRRLAPGGRFCIITFHSIEDRIVKQKFREWCTACTCPPDLPVCICGGVAKAKAITRKPIRAGEEELEHNHRSRSASLRIIEKL